MSTTLGVSYAIAPESALCFGQFAASQFQSLFPRVDPYGSRPYSKEFRGATLRAARISLRTIEKLRYPE